MEFGVLGPLEVVVDGRPVVVGGPRERALLCDLLIRPNQAVSLQRLADDLAGEDALDAESVRVYVSRLRKALRAAGAEDTIETRTGGYVLVTDLDSIDAHRFERMAAAARQELGNHQPEAAGAMLREALQLWRGPALADVADAPFAQAEAARLEEARLAALEDRVEADLAVSRHGELAGELESLTATHPLRERLWGQRMLALYRAGRQADALRTYQQLRQTLAEDLGIEPSPALRDLEQAILEQRRSLSPSAPGDGDGAVRTPALPTGVVTFLLTDVVGSGSLWESAPQAMVPALELRDAALQVAVRSNGGTVLRSGGEGDGTFSVFARASDAVAAAVAAQHALAAVVWPAECKLRVRMGVHTGEAIEHAGDYVGPAVNRAARLRALADGGQAVCSRATAELVAEQLAPTVTLVELGEQQLAGLARPEAVFAVVDGSLEVTAHRQRTLPQARTGAFPPPLPAPMRSREEQQVFVGRGAELARLEARWREAMEGPGQAVFVAGEPGIGKTRLAAELARSAYEQGAAVLFGRCDEEALTPYQPIHEALRHLVVSTAPETLAGLLGRDGADLAVLVPEVRERLSDLPEIASSDPESERYRLFEAVVGVLSRVAGEAPLLLVLDDLHWADRSTLALIRHVLRHAKTRAVLVVGTYRHTELTARHPLAELVADLRRDRPFERLALGGLSAQDLVDWFEALAGYDLGEGALAFAETLQRQTDGNPYFVEEVLLHLAETGAIYQKDQRWRLQPGMIDLGIPEAVREVVGYRLRRLSEPVQRVLTVAAVVGPEFDIDILEAAGELQGDTLVDSLDEAIAAGVVSEVPGLLGRYRFSHALVRETLYGQLSSLRRARLHLQVGDALERLVGADPSARLAEIAHHFLEGAGPRGDSSKAVEYALAAGALATAQLAYEQAAALYGRALEVADDPSVSRTTRADVQIALGSALRLAGDPHYADVLLSAAEEARAAGDTERLARAALELTRRGMHVVTDSGGLEDPRLLALLEEALAGLDTRDSSLRARLLAALAVELAFTAAPDRRVELITEATAMARRMGVPATLATVLMRHQQAAFGTPLVTQRAHVAYELIELGRQLGDLEVSFRAQHSLYFASVAEGDGAKAAEALEEAGRLADEIRQPLVAWQAAESRAVHALVTGRLEEAEGLAEAAMGVGLDSSLPDDALLALYGALLLVLRFEQGRLEEMEALLAPMLEALPDAPSLPGVLAFIYASLGREDDARPLLERSCAVDASDAPHDFDRVTTLSIFGWAAAGVGDLGRAEAIYRHLAPFRGLAAVDEHVCLGPVDRTLALLAAALGRPEDADRHFAAAAHWCERIGAPTWLARTRAEWSAALARRGAPGDAERGKELAALAAEAAESLGMAGVLEDSRALLG